MEAAHYFTLSFFLAKCFFINVNPGDVAENLINFD